ncbi:DUF1345 domain-containing protein [Dictyobacter arantiisoli]|uniref:DUF1345 domain-containing protein n=1 Tax=Dictyobacter arantiisoli TaxID=2014874 RepID=A0A5A5TH47_9CHLR|nr:DUF1345 domain-containing protein [Dictyobacter arantiisoli]GCF10476.1 hypothetical protein KDI_40400 [Dictyobacter arantiisoli]
MDQKSQPPVSEASISHSADEKEPHLVGQLPKVTVSVGTLLVGIFYYFLPDELRIGPGWTLIVIEVVLLLPIWQYWITGRPLPHFVARRLLLIMLVLVTIALSISVVLLISRISTFKSGFQLLRSATLLWLTNIAVFALWYWNMDGGGPRKRHEAGHKAVDFLFPQQASGIEWVPQFFDYFFVSFTGATAFSPTDTYPLTRRAKMLMMIEGLLSLAIVAVLISRVANIF